MRNRYEINAKSTRYRCVFAAELLRSRREVASQSLCYRNALAANSVLKSMQTRCGIDLESLPSRQNRFTIAIQLLRSHGAVGVLSLYSRSAIALRSLCDHSWIALHYAADLLLCSVSPVTIVLIPMLPSVPYCFYFSLILTSIHTNLDSRR
jgi:hypothetical protein